MDDASVLLLESTPERSGALARRIRSLGGYRPLAAKSPEQALRLVEEPHLGVRSVLLSPDFPFTDPERALTRMRSLCGTRRLRFIATGVRPGADTLARLRAAGTELALWEPYDDARLRFQINRSLAAPEQESVRREQRAPTDWRARVRGGGREKEALVYSVSPGGAFLATPRPSMRGAQVCIELPLPAGSLSLEGRVLYTNVPGNLRRSDLPIGMGVVFDTPSPEAERELRFTVAQTLLMLVV
ncbi:MAG: PilZ domain-containing protein [Deltaproteobacteria bacterium]|nr:PilZ domain-containing protein [Deltaproteobacteria bacterium]